MRLDGQYLGLRRRVCGAGWDLVHRAAAGGKNRDGKVAQAFMYGAKVVAIDGNFDDALRLVREIGETEQVSIVNSINPLRIEGQKTASFEIIDELGGAPDLHILPVGNAGNITAYWRGYREFYDKGRAASCRKCSASRPRAPRPFTTTRSSRSGDGRQAIRIGNPASWQLAGAAIGIPRRHRHRNRQRNSGRAALAGGHEGIFVEPASAASIAAFSNAWAGTGAPPVRCPRSARRSAHCLHRDGPRPQGPDMAREQCG